MRSDSGLEGARRKFPNREMARHTPEIEKRHFGSRAGGLTEGPDIVRWQKAGSTDDTGSLTVTEPQTRLHWLR